MLESRRREYQASWANAEFVLDPAQNAIAIGYCKAVDDLINMGFQELSNAE